MNGIATFFRESGPARFLIPTGIILLIFGVVVLIINNGNKNYIEVQSTVTKVEVSQEAYTDTDGNNVEATYKVNVKYNVNGEDYEQELDGVSKYKVGDKIKIYYNPDDPKQITQTKSMILPIALMIGGFVALVCGIVSAINAVKKHKNLKNQEKGWANNG